MNRHPVLRKLAIAAALLLGSGMVSCISVLTGRATIVDTGGAIANIGQQRPRLHPEPPQEKSTPNSGNIHYRVWKKGKAYLVEYPVCYAPANYSVLVHFSGHYTWKKKTLKGEFPARYSDAELAQYPAELFYAELTAEQFEKLVRRDRRIKRPSPAPFRDIRLRPASEVDLKGAELVQDIHSKRYAPVARIWHNSRELPPPRRTWYNLCLMPLSWAAEVVDIPLSLIATPIGWLVDAIYEPLNN